MILEWRWTARLPRERQRGRWRAHLYTESSLRQSTGDSLGPCLVAPLRSCAGRPLDFLIPCTPVPHLLFVVALVSGAEGLGLAFGVESDCGQWQMISHGKKVGPGAG